MEAPPRHVSGPSSFAQLAFQGVTRYPNAVASELTKCVKPLRHLVRLSAKSSRSTNQNASFGRLSTACC
jgi:hypothetical protein